MTAFRIGRLPHRRRPGLDLGAAAGTRPAAGGAPAAAQHVVAPWQPSLTVDTDRLAARGLPVPAGRPDRPSSSCRSPWRRRQHRPDRDRQRRHHLAGLQPLGRLQPLHQRPDGRLADRSRAVSFDRPYQAKDDAGRRGLPVLRAAAGAVRRAQPGCRWATPPTSTCTPTRTCSTAPAAMVTLGHDEYWSQQERDNATAARDRGVNLAFLGGNEIYRHIRFEPSPLGPDRVEVDYKVVRGGPGRTPPTRPRPPRSGAARRTRARRACCSATSTSATRRRPTWSRSTRATGCCRASCTDGQVLPGLIGNEYERVDLRVPTPRPIEVLFHSPVTCGGQARLRRRHLLHDPQRRGRVLRRHAVLDLRPRPGLPGPATAPPTIERDHHPAAHRLRPGAGRSRAPRADNLARLGIGGSPAGEAQGAVAATDSGRPVSTR